MRYLIFLSRFVGAVALCLGAHLSLSTVAVLFVFINGGLLFFSDAGSDLNGKEKFGSLNCNLERAVWAGILWHMLLYTRDMIGFHV